MINKISFILFFTVFLFVISRESVFSQADVVLTIGHTDQINCLDINPEGTLIASGGNDNLVKLWDISTTKELRTFTGNDSRVVHIMFDPSGKYVSALNYADKLNTWDISSGKLISSFEAASNTQSFDFCRNGKAIAFYNLNNELVIADHTNGNILDHWEVTGIARMKTDPSGKNLYFLDYKGNLIGIDMDTKTEILKAQLFEEFSYPVTRIDIDRNGKLLSAAFTDNTIQLFNLKDGSRYHTFQGHENRLTDMQFEKNGDRLISADHNKQIFVWDVKNKKESFHHESEIFGANYLCVHPKEAIFLYCEFKTMHYCTIDDGVVQKKFQSKGNRVLYMDYAQDDKYLATAYDDLSIKLWDISKNKIDKKLNGFFPVRFSPDAKKLVCMGSVKGLFVYDPVTGNQLAELDTEYELIQNLTFSKDGKYLAGAGFGGVIRIWNMETGKIEKRLVGHAGGIYGTAFSPDGSLLASAGLDYTVRVWDLKKGKEIQVLNGHEVLASDVEFSPDGKILASCGWDKKIFLWNTSTWALDKKLEGHENIILGIDFSADGKYLASCAGNNTVAVADNSIRIWEVATGNVVCKFENPTGQVNDIEFEDGGNLLFSCSNDGMAKIWDITKCSEVVSLASVGVNDHVIVTPDFYYTASKDALSAISFRLGDKLFPFEQFDIKLNRPDVVAERVGKTPSNLVNAYKYVYEKRLKKLNFTPEQLSSEFHLPITRINTKKINLLTTDSVLKFMVHVEDDKYALNRLMVYLNGVPVSGNKGIDLTAYKDKSIDYEVKLHLMDGNNQIQVSCINEKGAESLIESFGVVKESTAEKFDLYLVSIGVSKYEQAQFNLNYAAKDAGDIIKKLSDAHGMYKKVHTLEITDAGVTRSKIKEIKEFIHSAGINDVVIIFMAGHGVLDENFDYYYATHDMNFEKPAEKGIAYSEIESLLDGIKSIKKLLLMDTCHSGELDKDEAVVKPATIEVKEVKFRAVGNAMEVKDAFGAGNMQELMNVLFTDVRKASGATVISSSGGAEFSMESDKYKNGLFTFCLLNSFSDYTTDVNHDQIIRVSEWSKYALENVYRLSGGMQKPTSRAENLLIDFRVR